MHSKEQLWSQCLLEIQKIIPPESFSTWFSPIHSHLLTEDKFIIAVPNEFYKACLQENYYEIIESTLLSLTNKSIQLEFKTETITPNQTEQPPVPKIEEPDQTYESSIYTSSSINYRYNFSNFIVGSSNQFAHAAAMAVANNPTMTYNPLFIYGGVGLGKTHLLHAVGNAILTTSIL